VKVTSHTSDVQRSYVINSGRLGLNQSGDNVITAVSTQRMSTRDEQTNAAAAENDDEVDDDDEDSPTEQRLMRQLLRRYETAVRPVRNASDTVMVRMGLTLTQIFNMVSHIRAHLSHSLFTSND